MNRKALCVTLLSTISVWVAGCSSGSSTVVVGPPALVTASSGTPQTTAVNTMFGAPLVALVSDSKGNPVPGVVVTFTAPATGATAIFAGGVNTAATDASGLATSSIVSANGTIGGPYTVTASVSGVQMPADFSLQNTAGTPATITPTSGTPQSTAVNTAFGAPLVAQVLDSKGNPVSGVTVTFMAPASGASVTFAGGVNTTTTTSSGVATSPVVTANGTVGGPYTVTASVKGVAAPANFSLTNTAAAAATKNFAFYVSGLEAGDERRRYSIAGVFALNTTSGEVLGGEQDYNDGDNVISPQPSGDKITGGSFTVDVNTSSARLILTTNNPSVGRGGKEAFAVQVVNANHALIAQDDGTAISTGSMDLQTLPSVLAAPTGAFAFCVSGVDSSLDEMASGGIFKLTGNDDGTATLRGTIDTNDAGSRTLDTSLAAELSPPDSFGRGTITNSTAAVLGLAINYYVVGPEVIRLINVDKGIGASTVGSAYGQGSGTFGNHSLVGSSVFGVGSSPDAAVLYAAAGRLSASNVSSDPASFTGVADVDENGLVQGGPTGSTISGTYTIDKSGYGKLLVTNENEAPNRGLADLSLLGLYMVDPLLNINDPNNTVGGGGALIVDLGGDGATVGTGVLIPQTDTSTASFAGTYAFGGQAFFLGGQLESVAGRALSGTGIMQDAFYSFGLDPTNRRALIAGTPIADYVNAGRYIMRSPTPLTANIASSGESIDFNVVIYQANATELFWLDEDEHSLWVGPLEQQPPTPLISK